MPIISGQRVGPYEIGVLLGAGGMGEVYRARDTRLGRYVAVKVLPDAFRQDAERMARFEREAQVLAALNHPNIAAIYGLEVSGDVQALVMELVEGQTLAGCIAQGPIPVTEALGIAGQITEGLEYAHEKGIIHRDLKPANVKLAADGTLKLLDFGLAKAVEEPAVAGNPASSPTVTMRGTRAEVILGTAAYMSPEQASGKPVDRRSDIWSFGVVLWEMLTGKPLFEGETISHTLADVLRAPIDLRKLPPETPVAIRNLLRRCLDRDPRNRLRDIGEARVAIQQCLTNPASEAEPAGTPAPSGRGWLWPSATAACLLLAAALAFVHFGQTSPAGDVVRFEIGPPRDSHFTCCVSISPDGRKIAFTAQRSSDPRPSLWIRALDSIGTKPVYQNFTGGPSAPHPFWSPDSRFLAFSADQKLRRVDVSGGPPQTICDTPPGFTGGAWSPQGVIILGSSAGLMRVSADGGTPTMLTMVDPSRKETGHTGPTFLPGGSHFLYLRRSPENNGIYVGSLDVRASTQDNRQLLVTDLPAEYAPLPGSRSGYILFLRESTLMAQPFDPDKRALSGEAVPVVESVEASNGRGIFAASSNGTLIYRGGLQAGRRLTWLDRQGKALGHVGDQAAYVWPTLAPDGIDVASERESPTGQPDIWLLDSRGVSSRFTFGPAANVDPLWSPDGSRIIFSSNRGGHYDLYEKASNGAADDTLLVKSDEDKLPTGWSPDGRFLIFTSINPKTGHDVWLLPDPGGAQNGRAPVPWLRTEFFEHFGSFSPDMRWIAYVSNESGPYHVYVRRFTPPGSAGSSAGNPFAGGKWQISRDGAGLAVPHWRSDGKELLFEGLQGGIRGIMAVEVSLTPEFRAANPQLLFRLPAGSGGWDVTADGKRFLAALREDTGGDSATPPESISVVLNWMARLKP